MRLKAIEHNGRTYILHPGWKLNPNEKVVKGITKGIDRCKGECPCDNPYKGTEDAKCPCRGYLHENRCCCTLYLPKWWMKLYLKIKASLK